MGTVDGSVRCEARRLARNYVTAKQLVWFTPHNGLPLYPMLHTRGDGTVFLAAAPANNYANPVPTAWLDGQWTCWWDTYDSVSKGRLRTPNLRAWRKRYWYSPSPRGYARSQLATPVSSSERALKSFMDRFARPALVAAQAVVEAPPAFTDPGRPDAEDHTFSAP